MNNSKYIDFILYIFDKNVRYSAPSIYNSFQTYFALFLTMSICSSYHDHHLTKLSIQNVWKS